MRSKIIKTNLKKNQEKKIRKKKNSNTVKWLTVFTQAVQNNSRLCNGEILNRRLCLVEA